MTSIQLFNNLNGKEVSRNYLEEILQQAKTENQTSVIYRISKILNDYPNVQHFDINIVQYPQGLAGAMHTGDYREALDDCGRLKKGWKFVKGNVIKVEKKEKKEVSKPKKQVTKTEKKATETEKEYKITHEIRLQYPKSYTDDDIIASMKKMDKFRKNSKEIQKKNKEKKEESEKEQSLSLKINKKDKEEIKYLEREIKSEEAFMSSLSRDRRAVEEWIKTGDLSVFNHYKIYGADAEAVRKQYERGGIESFRSQYGLAQKRIKKHTTQIEKIKQKYAEAEKPCNTCGKKSSNALTIAGDSATKLNILLSSTEKENQSAKDIQNIFDKKLSKMLRLQSGFINTNEFDFKAPKTSKKGIESFEKIVIKDELRPAMTGVLIEKDFYVGTDAHKLLVIERTKNDGLKTGKIYDVNARYINYLNVFKNIDDALSEKEWNDERYIDAVFPNYETVFPKQYLWKTPFVDIEPILNHAYKAYYLLKFDVQKEDSYTIPFRIGKLDIYISALKLFESLQCLYVNGTKQVSFECVAYNKPMTIKSKENKSVALLMPVFGTKKKELNVNEVQITATENKDFKESQGLTAPCLSGLSAPTAQSAETIAFNKEILKAKRKGGFERNEIFTLGKTKDIVKKYLGNHTISISSDVLKKAMEKDGDHIATFEHFINLPDVINNPVAIFKSKTENGSFVLLTELINDKEKPLLIAAHINKSFSILKIASIYAKRSITTYHKWYKENRAVYINKKSFNSLLPRPMRVSQTVKGQSKGTKKSVSSKKTDKNFGLGLPLTDEIRKKAFTDKGKLRKGWYYDKYGVLTDGKYLYLPKGKKEYEYEAIQHQIIEDTDNYRYIRYQAEDYQGEARSKNDKIADEQRKTFYEDVAKSLKKDFPNITREDVYDIHNTYVTKDNQRYFTFSAEDLKADSVKEFLKQYALKIGKKYHFNEKAHEVRKRIEAFLQKQTTQLRGDRKAIRRKHGLAAPAPVVETPQELTPSVAHRPEVFVEESLLTTEGETYQTEPVNTLPAVANHRKGSLAEQLANAPTQTESYQIDRYDMAQFLGDMEIKNVDSLVITLTGGQGSGKTRFAFQFMNDLAQRYKVGHISIEEHPQSRLYIEKAHQYLNENAMNNIEAHDVRSLSEIDKIIRENEVIVIDSFQKIKEIDSKFEVDKDLRKKYNGKLFLVIFQQTTEGKMRGGSKSQFDGDIILFTEKFANYQENYVYPDKNRYNPIPADQLRYNIFQQRLLPAETEEQTTENQVYDVIY
ncbi:hypothetical protein ACI76O_05330 [Capnocytophaga cynodegmi]|uniref:MuF-C-terminal domain-containing protein n=1 Tax=Capnocytophaga cynodegmi TaxID=28189 RepID=UPI00385C4398